MLQAGVPLIYIRDFLGHKIDVNRRPLRWAASPGPAPHRCAYGLTGMKIDVNRPVIALGHEPPKYLCRPAASPPAVHPIAVRMVYQVANAVKVPVIGMGVTTAEDALEFILAGATGVAVGTANFKSHGHHRRHRRHPGLHVGWVKDIHELIER